MASLTGKTPAQTYKDLLQVSNSNNGIDSTVRKIEDGEGTESVASISVDALQLYPMADGKVFVARNAAGTELFSIDTSTNLITLANGVTLIGDGSGLTGVTPAGVGGASATGNLELTAGTEGNGDIIIKIGTTVVARIPYSYLAKLAVGIEENYFHSPEITNYSEITELGANDYVLAVDTTSGKTRKISGANLLTQEDINLIGVAGEAGFGVGIAPVVPSTMQPMSGFDDKTHDNYGNYSVKADGSVMVWIPRCYYKLTHLVIADATASEGSVTLTVASHNLKVGEHVFIASATGLACNGRSIITAVTPTTIVITHAATGTYNANSGYIFNSLNIRGIDTYPQEANANADGYALHRAFIDGGVIKDGVFVDKYDWSLTSYSTTTGIASSIKNGNPISSSADTNRNETTKINYAGSFSNCKSNSQTPSDNYAGCFAVSKSRGANFAPASTFIYSLLAMLSLAHGQASSATTNCAWYHSTFNFPRGSNGLSTSAGGENEGLTWSTCDDAYWAGKANAMKTGSTLPFAKSTHNGQNCGVADLNGNLSKVKIGLTCIAPTGKTASAATKANPCVITTSTEHEFNNGEKLLVTGFTAGTDSGTDWTTLNNTIVTVANKSNNTFELAGVDTTGFKTWASGGTFTKGTFYVLKESVALKSLTGGNTLSTDAFGATGVAANYDTITIPFKNGAAGLRWGSGTNQALSGETNRSSNSYKLTNSGLPLADTSVDVTGTSQLGQDYFYQYIINDMLPRGAGCWSDTSGAGVWCVYLSNARTFAYTSVSGRSCLYV